MGRKTIDIKRDKMIRLQDLLEQKFKECPPATQDVDLNTKNRDATVKNHNYGPLNTDEPGDYWEKVADQWNTSVEAARTSLCGNCTAFDISTKFISFFNTSLTVGISYSGSFPFFQPLKREVTNFLISL